MCACVCVSLVLGKPPRSLSRWRSGGGLVVDGRVCAGIPDSNDDFTSGDDYLDLASMVYDTFSFSFSFEVEDCMDYCLAEFIESIGACGVLVLLGWVEGVV